jgi:hypothetical protein
VNLRDPDISETEHELAEDFTQIPRSLDRSGVCECLGLLQAAPGCGVLSLFLCNAGDTIRAFCSGAFLCADFCNLLLRGRMVGKLEMSSMRAGVFPGCIFSQPVWRALFPLWPPQMVRVGDRRYHFPAQVSVWLGSYRSTEKSQWMRWKDGRMGGWKNAPFHLIRSLVLTDLHFRKR